MRAEVAWQKMGMVFCEPMGGESAQVLESGRPGSNPALPVAHYKPPIHTFIWPAIHSFKRI